MRLSLRDLTFLGYGYLLALAAVAVGGGVAVMTHLDVDDDRDVLALVLLGLLLFIVVRALTLVRYRRPEGRIVTASDAPALFEALREISGALGVTSPDRVEIDDGLNAMAVQVPRFGPFGSRADTLVLGLPLLLAESPAAFRATLAHELAHLAGDDGRAQAKLQRLQVAWHHLADTNGTIGHWTGFVFVPFYRWFAPRFDLGVARVCRDHEVHADALAAESVGAESAAASLVTLALRARWLEERFWPEVERLVAVEAEAPRDVFARMAAGLREPVPEGQARAWLAAALAERTAVHDSHPSLAERLDALGWGEDTPLPACGGRSAAEALLGEDLTADLAEELGARWARAHGPRWRARHEGAAAEAARLETLDHMRRRGVRRDEEIVEHAALVDAHRGPEAALPLLAEAVAAAPEDRALRLRWGRALARAGDPRTVEALEAVAEEDVDRRLAAWLLLRDHFAAQGEADRAEALTARLDAFREGLARAQRERRRIHENLPMRPHGLDDAAVAEVVRALRRVEGVAQAWLVRVDVRWLPELPMRILALRTDLDGQGLFTGKAERAIAQAVIETVRVEGDLKVVLLGSFSQAFHGALLRVEGAEIYRA